MLEIIGPLLGFVIIIAATTLAAVLLARFWLPGQTSGARIGIAAAGGPSILGLAVAVIALLTNDFGFELLIGLGAIVLVPMLFVGWPVSYWATRKLDKLTMVSASVFE